MQTQARGLSLLEGRVSEQGGTAEDAAALLARVQLTAAEERGATQVASALLDHLVLRCLSLSSCGLENVHGQMKIRELPPSQSGPRADFSQSICIPDVHMT